MCQVDKITNMISIEDMTTLIDHNWCTTRAIVQTLMKNEPEMKAKIKLAKLNGKGWKKYCTSLETMGLGELIF